MSTGLVEEPPALHHRSAVIIQARRLSRRAYRISQKQFIVEGPSGVSSAITHCPQLVQKVFISESAQAKYSELIRQMELLPVLVHRVTDKAAASIADTVNPSGICAVVDTCDVSVEDVTGRKPVLVVIAMECADPGNAGALIRVADAAGADAIIFTGSGVDIYNGKCVRSTVGSFFQIPICVHPDVREVLVALSAAGCRTIATSGKAQMSLADLSVNELSKPTAWLFGNEAHGLPTAIIAACDVSIAIPIYGKAESLNLAQAAAICIYTSALRHASQ